jgi:uncharacterized membrane protein YkvA (DUF1232 family)
VGALQRFWADKDAARWKKALLVLLLFYVIFPLDLIPDFAPFWGWLDDLGAASGAWMLLTWMLGPYSIRDEHPKKAGMNSDPERRRHL